jgi:opacity protein-like surface antigen
MQSNDNIKDLFSSKLANFEPQLPSGMWDKINDSLSADAAQQPPARKIALLKVISLASGIAAMLAISFLLLTYTREDNALADKPIIDNDKATIDEPVNAPEPVDAQTLPEPLYAKVVVQPRRNRQPAPVELKAADKEPEHTRNNEPQEVPQGNIQVNNHPYNDEDLKRKIEAFEEAGRNDALLADATLSTAPGKKGITVSVSGSSGFSELTDKKVPVPTKFLKYAVLPNANYEMAASSSENRPVWPGSRVKIEHQQPVSFGLKIDKRLSNHFSVETGVVCTYLSSKLTPADSNSDNKVEGYMKFYYIGMPLSLNYTFARLGDAEFYFSAGGMIQKDISGKIAGNQEFKNWLNQTDPILIEDHISDKISQENPQLSIMANAGLSYPLYKILNVYVTVGGAYYFDDKNEFRTVYSDKQLQLDLNVGLKLKF